jgi:hypothetical protein
MTMYSKRTGIYTPWGQSDYSKDYSKDQMEKIVFHSTSSHGGLFVDPDLNQLIPYGLRRESGWYEEDCEFHIPAYFLFDQMAGLKSTKEECLQGLKDWFPSEWEKVMKVILQRGESAGKDRDYWDRVDNIGKLEKRACWGDWAYDVPKGMVYAIFQKVTRETAEQKKIQPKGEEVTGLITDAVYNSGNFISESDVTFFKRSNEYSTWDEFTRMTGKERFK